MATLTKNITTLSGWDSWFNSSAATIGTHYLRLRANALGFIESDLSEGTDDSSFEICPVAADTLVHCTLQTTKYVGMTSGPIHLQADPGYTFQGVTPTVWIDDVLQTAFTFTVDIHDPTKGILYLTDTASGAVKISCTAATRTFLVNYSLQHATGASSNPTTIQTGNAIVCTFTPSSGYQFGENDVFAELPDGSTVNLAKATTIPNTYVLDAQYVTGDIHIWAIAHAGEKLDTPTNVEVTGTQATWDEVTFAEQYGLYVSSTPTGQVTLLGIVDVPEGGDS